MNTRRTLAALVAAFAMGCGPTTISVTTSSGEGGESSDAPDSSGPSVGSTGIGGSETGLVDTSATTGASSGGSSDPNSGGGSSSTGEPLPECFVDPWIGGQLACWCDGALSDPIACGCADYPDGCECDHGSTTSPLPCLTPGCFVIAGACYCDTQLADPSECEGQCAAVQSDDGWACLCDGAISDPALCGCVLPAPGVCSCPGGTDAPCIGPQGVGACLPGVPCCSVVAGDCICDGVSAPIDYCECVTIGALCLCGGVVSPPESC